MPEKCYVLSDIDTYLNKSFNSRGLLEKVQGHILLRAHIFDFHIFILILLEHLLKMRYHHPRPVNQIVHYFQARAKRHDFLKATNNYLSLKHESFDFFEVIRFRKLLRD